MMNKRAERSCRHQQNNTSKFCDVLDEIFDGSEAIILEKITKVNWRHVDKDVLHVQKNSEVERRLNEFTLKHFPAAQQKNPKQNSVVLEMNVIDENQSNVGQQENCMINFSYGVL
jgi:hypothetical protein